MIKMSKEQSLIDLDCSQCNVLRNQDPASIQEIINVETQLAGNRNKFLNKLHDYIAQIQSKLVSLKSEVHGDFTMELRDADYYRISMFQLEGKITQLKQSINTELCNLMKEENEVSRELQFMERRVEEWSKPVKSRPVKSVPSACNNAHADPNDPSSELHKLVWTSGGHSGGWDEQDHNLFLRERRKYHGQHKFIKAVHALLPDINEQQILAHETWYHKYETLKKEQKDAIKKWRATRQSSLDKRQDSWTDEREGSGQRNQPRNYAAQRDITDRIREWKRQQLIKQAEEEERQKEDIQLKNEERERTREMQKAKKSSVNAYKADKLSRLQAEMLSNQMKQLQALEDRAKKSVLLKAFREQDEQLMEKKKMQKFKMEYREKKRLARLRNVKPAIELTVDRDPQRTVQPTQAWHHHVSHQPDTNTAPPALHLNTIPHLAVPSWRKGLSNTATL